MAPVSLDDLLAYVRDPRWSYDFAGYGWVAHLLSDTHPELQTLWLAVISAVTTPLWLSRSARRTFRRSTGSTAT